MTDKVKLTPLLCVRYPFKKKKTCLFSGAFDKIVWKPIVTKDGTQFRFSKQKQVVDLPVVVGVMEVTAEGVLQRYSQIFLKFLTFFDVSVYICSMNTSFMVSFFKKKKKKTQHFNTDFVKIKPKTPTAENCDLYIVHLRLALKGVGFSPIYSWL